MSLALFSIIGLNCPPRNPRKPSQYSREQRTKDTKVVWDCERVRKENKVHWPLSRILMTILKPLACFAQFSSCYKLAGLLRSYSYPEVPFPATSPSRSAIRPAGRHYNLPNFPSTSATCTYSSESSLPNDHTPTHQSNYHSSCAACQTHYHPSTQ
jgi:hypothetical protein